MKINTNIMNENSFIKKIDCTFPYKDLIKGYKIIDEAIKISDNCVFVVLHELVRIPNSINKNDIKDNLVLFLKYLEEQFNHELKESSISISKDIILGNKLYENQILELMEGLKEYKGVYGMLNILYFSIDDNNGKIEEKYNEILNYWKMINNSK